MRAAIVGATGVLGRHLLPLLLAEDYTVRALARTPEQTEALAALGVEAVPGALLAPDAGERLPALVAGCAAVLRALQRAPAGAVFNICDGPLRQGEYLDRLADLLDVPPPPRDPTRACPPSYRCSHYAARTELPWEPIHGTWPTPAAPVG